MSRRVINIFNKQAGFEFIFLDNYTAGIVLQGTEIKSIIQNKVNFQDAFCYIKDHEMFIKNMHISTYKEGSYLNHDPLRERKLLLRKKEIVKIENRLKEQGITVVPIKMFTNERGFIKIEIALAKGKKLFDKRESLKEKDAIRELKKI
jgi:SsrA-binding protein